MTPLQIAVLVVVFSVFALNPWAGQGLAFEARLAGQWWRFSAWMAFRRVRWAVCFPVLCRLQNAGQASAFWLWSVSPWSRGRHHLEDGVFRWRESRLSRVQRRAVPLCHRAGTRAAILSRACCEARRRLAAR